MVLPPPLFDQLRPLVVVPGSMCVCFSQPAIDGQDQTYSVIFVHKGERAFHSLGHSIHYACQYLQKQQNNMNKHNHWEEILTFCKNHHII